MAGQINDPGNANAPKRSNEVLGWSDLTSYVTYHVRQARESRDRQYKARWDAYERTYRGFWSKNEATRDGERSRIIAPALAQAIDSTAASIEDAIFSRDQWFDAVDDRMDQESSDMEAARLNLVEDFEVAGVPEQIAKVVLNGCLYGTGIGKINITRREVKTVKPSPQGPKTITEVRPVVTLDAIPPWEFVIDTQARDLQSALFCAHETNVPRNVVWTKQKQGIYRNVVVTGWSGKMQNPAGLPAVDENRKHGEFDGSVFVTEYYGLVPKHLLKGKVEVKPEDVQGNGMVECIVTIANESEVLRAQVNPFLMKDRPIIAYQHDVVPGKFWGRGVAEKGWNAQRALDAELRARMDALGLLTSPMMGADITRLPRNPDMRVRPGKVWLTRGRPSEVLEPVILGNIDPQTFNQSSEMERLVQVGTGSVESNAPLNTDRRNETASGISMIQSSALKRMKRTMWNVERQFLNPLVRKTMWRLMQFNSPRYPKDYEFQVKGAMSVVAREFEQSNLTALLSVIPPDAPAYNVVLKGVIELSGTPKRDELLKAIDAANKPDPEAQKMQQQQMQLQMQAAQMEVAKLQAEVEEIKSKVRLNEEKARQTRIEADLEDEKVDIQAANTAIGREKTRATFEQNEVARERNRIEAMKAQRERKEKKDD
jgi:hypothetical protein